MASTYVGDGMIGRARTPRGIYAMGAPHMDMSHYFSQWENTEKTETNSMSNKNKHEISIYVCFMCLKRNSDRGGGGYLGLEW